MANLKEPYYNLDGIEKNFNTLYGEIAEWQIDRYKAAFDKFKREFKVDCAFVASSSGRVEVCGNHTDHNGGKVLSCAISLDTLAMFMPSNNDVIHIKSEGYQDIVVNLNEKESEKIGTSAALVRGVIVSAKQKGYKVGGFNAYFTSNVLGGAGISSSASFEVLVAEIVNFLYNDGNITCEEKAVIAQFAENVYFGKPCGLLDQTAIAFGGLKMLDFSNKSKIVVSKINNVLSDYTFVLINTGGSHADLTDEYAAIPVEMFKIANLMGVDRLIDCTKEEFFKKLPNIKASDRAILRAIHFYEENERVDVAYTALNNNDIATFLKAVSDSGVSSLCKLQNCYVSGSDDQAIPKALAISANYLNGGANRVHGGGFAGSILNIVKTENLQDFINEMSKYFSEENIIPLKVRSVGTIVL